MTALSPSPSAGTAGAAGAAGPAADVPRAPRRAALVLLATEARLWLREPGTVFFALAFPTVLLLGVGFAIPGMRTPIEDAPPPWGGVTPVALYLPVVLAAAIATPALTTMPVHFATFREKGVLRRLSTTPMRPQRLVGAHLVINLVAVVVATSLAVLVGQLAFGLVAPRSLPTVLLAFVLGVVSMYALGTLVAARAPRASTASAVGTLIYFPLLFLSGLWTPGPIMPEAVRVVGGYTPLGAAAQAMTAGWFEDGFPAHQVVVMVAWTAVLLPLGVRLFRWS